MDNKLSREDLENIWSDYKNTSIKTEEVKLQVIEKVKDNLSNSLLRIFSADRDMAKRISLAQLEQEAEVSKAYIQPNDNKSILKMIVMLAEVSCKYQDDITEGFDQERVAVWKKVFSNVIEFSLMLDQKIEEINKKLNLVKDTKSIEVKEVVKLFVPILFKDEQTNKKTEQIPKQLIDEMVNHYNNFYLHQYMELPFVCLSTQLEINENVAVFSFNTTDILSEENKKILKKELLGQLSDGWGESLSQRKELVDTNVVYLEFTNKATFRKNKSNKSNKIKP